jgi:2',3'-cyclic-nucleotide 2'-phosphodiesterase (5'-nucleotidase family)
MGVAMRLTLILAALAALTACPHERAGIEAPARPTTLVILHTNDTHGYIWGSDAAGTAAQRAHVIDTARREAEAAGAVVVTLDAGDVRTGSLCSDRQRAEPDLEAMEAAGYDAMEVGNHEFDQPYTVLLEQRALVDFPILGANVLSSATGEPLLDPVAIIARAGLRVGVLGLVTTEASTGSTTGSDPALRFDDPFEVARRLVPELRGQADVVVVLSHLGLGVDRRLAREVPGIDVIIGGHSHDALEAPIVEGSTVISQAGGYGNAVGRVELEVGAAGGVRLVGGRLLPVGRDLPAQPEVAAVLERYACRDADEAIVELGEPITRDPIAGLGTSSALSNVVTDAIRELAGADVAFTNRGGLRADLAAGTVTAAALHAVLPFENTLVVVEATGADLEAIARSVASRGPGGAGVLLPSGLELELGPGDRARALIGGAPVDPAVTYTVALSSFLADGGDGHEAIARLRRVRELPQTPADALAAYLRAHAAAGTLQVDRASRSRWVQGGQKKGRRPAARAEGRPWAPTRRPEPRAAIW